MMQWMIVAFGMLAAAPAAAQVTFDAPFTDHAVLQRDRAIAVHGHAAPKAEIVLNFADVPYMDSVGLNAIVRAHMALVRAGGRLALTGVPKHLAHILSVTRLTTVFAVYESEPKAVQSFEGDGA